MIPYILYAAFLVAGYLVRHWTGAPGAPATPAGPAVPSSHPMLTAAEEALQALAAQEKAILVQKIMAAVGSTSAVPAVAPAG